MLCQFSVKNYRCIKDEVVLDMQSTAITEHKDTVFVEPDGEKYLPLGVIYGPNGGGKSTVLNAISSLVCIIMRPICAALSCNNEDCVKNNTSVSVPFKFSKETLNEPTEYEMFFRTNLNEYQYIVSVKENIVIEEELYKKSLEKKNGRYSTVFTRTKNKEDNKKDHVKLYGSLKGYSCNDISDNITLLSYLGITHKKNVIVKDIIEWFENKILFIDYNNPLRDIKIPIANSDKTKKIVLDMLNEMDIDIVDYRVERKENKINIYTTHSVDDETFELDFNEESNGTIKIFGILPILVESIIEGCTLLIDELDAKLHPLLLKYIISLFNNPKINKKKAQLVFTSHDLSTMNNENFRRDEIWFVAKGQDLSSKMYSLVEFKNENGTNIRKDEKYNKRYLEGHYGADPYLKKIINWEEL